MLWPFFINFIVSFMAPFIPRCHCFPLVSEIGFLHNHFYLSTISYVHKIKGFLDPTKSFVIQTLLTALSRQRPTNIRLLVTTPVLHELIWSPSFTNSLAFQRSPFTAMFLLWPFSNSGQEHSPCVFGGSV